jgi:tetratricopeptide (TPR) repeat protein
MHAVTERSHTLDRELYTFEKADAIRVARIVGEMIQAKRIEDAVSLARAGVNMAPRSGVAWNVLSYAYSFAPGLEREQTAAAREAVIHSPEDSSAWHNLSLGLMKMFEFESALEASERAIALPSDNAYYPMNGAFLASLVGDHQRTLTLLGEARRRLTPEHAEYPKFLAEIDLTAAVAHAHRGDWVAFMDALESRHELATWMGNGPDAFLKTMWGLGRLWTQNQEWTIDGEAPGGEALVWLEWGIGDQIQFARLIPMVLREILRFRRVTVVCSRPLVELVRSIEGVDGVLEHGFLGLTPENVRPDVAVIPVIDLVRVAERFGLFPLGRWPGAYIKTPAAVTGWKPRREAGKIAIAFSWQGDPKQTQDFNRRIPFAEWGRFAKLHSDRYTFHSVQTKFGGHISPWEGWPDVPVDDAGQLIRDMRDTAEIISKCDVFVGQCGAPLHLAGAMGKPAVAMLGYAHDWRWDFEPLYDIGLVKQSRPGDWPSAFAKLDQAIDRVVTRRPAEISKES